MSAICPAHGAYNEREGCKQCGAAKPSEHPGPSFHQGEEGAYKGVGQTPALSSLSTDDKLTFKTMETQLVRAQLDVNTAVSRAQQAQQQLGTFITALVEKAGLDPKEYGIHPETLVFTKVVQPANK